MSRTELLLKRYKDYVSGREIYFDYTKDYEKFSSSVLKHTRTILFDNNATFSFERKGNSREGALTQKDTKLRIEGKAILTKVVKVRRDVDFVHQLHTYFHELAHLINEHNTHGRLLLSTPQKEYVAETVAQALLYSFAGGLLIQDMPSNDKWDQSLYIENWIKRAKFSEDKINLMWEQIELAYDTIRDSILEKVSI